MPDPTAQPDPLPLDDIERTGAVRFGRPVVRLVMVLEDGREIAADLPTAGPAELTGLTPTQRRIVQVLRVSPMPLTRKAVANRLGRSDATGKTGTDIRELVHLGYIFEAGGELTDDITKLPAGG
jgi:hypothetical protein